MRTFGKFIIGLLLGGLVGSILALLFAPVSGNDMRERVYDYCTNIRSEVKNAATMKAQELQNELSMLQKR
jgi:gas vesicle protein